MDSERARIRELKFEMLSKARADAERRGKEPFDLGKLEPLCDTSHEGRIPPPDERFAEFEWKYYVDFPTIMTIHEFAIKVDELNRW